MDRCGARKEEGVSLYTGVLSGADRFMASWHKSQEEASRLREVSRAAKALLTKTKRGNAEEEGGGEGEGKRRRGAASGHSG